MYLIAKFLFLATSFIVNVDNPKSARTANNATKAKTKLNLP